jgi:hypothetical protein
MTTTTREHFNSFGKGHLPGLVGVEIVTVTREAVESRMAVRKEVMAPNGFLHAASVIALADTSCGYGCLATLPEGAKGFTTVELKARRAGRRLRFSGARRWFCGPSRQPRPFMFESIPMTQRFFFGFFFYPSHLAEGAG